MRMNASEADCARRRRPRRRRPSAPPHASARCHNSRTGAVRSAGTKIIKCSRRLQRCCSHEGCSRALSHSDTFTFLLDFY